jgi:hypothetical protein
VQIAPTAPHYSSFFQRENYCPLGGVVDHVWQDMDEDVQFFSSFSLFIIDIPNMPHLSTLNDAGVMNGK